MDEIAPSLWHWTARHPEWTAEDDGADHGWGPDVSCYGYAFGDRTVLIDPAIPEGGLEPLLAGRDGVVVLTCPWHARDAARLGLPVHAPPPDPGTEDPLGSSHYAAGDRLPFGITVFPGLEPVDLVLWLEPFRALVFGDTLIDAGRGLELPDDWGPSGISHPDVLATLRLRLELPIELALPTHGPPADRAAFERALG